MTCNCHSYNRPERSGQRAEHLCLMPLPLWERTHAPGHQRRLVTLDACIAREIRALWDAGVATGGSCCGHGGLYGETRPQVVLRDGESAYYAHGVLRLFDPAREWSVLQWRSLLPGWEPVLGRVLRDGTFLEGP